MPKIIPFANIPDERLPSLPELLHTYNALIGWNQSDLAAAIGRDNSWLSKVMLGKIKRPYDEQLAAIVAAYNANGIPGLTLDTLIRARDRKPTQTNPFDIPNDWQMLVRTILSFPAPVQRFMFRITSVLVSELAIIFPAGSPLNDYDDEMDS